MKRTVSGHQIGICGVRRQSNERGHELYGKTMRRNSVSTAKYVQWH